MFGSKRVHVRLIPRIVCDGGIAPTVAKGRGFAFKYFVCSQFPKCICLTYNNAAFKKKNALREMLR